MRFRPPGRLFYNYRDTTEGNSWEFTGNRCGNRVGIWDLDRVPLKSVASGSDRTFFGPVTVT
jgi:hypothetical protein